MNSLSLAMEEEYPLRRFSLQEYPGRSFVLKSANSSPVTGSPILPGSPVLPMRRRATVSQPVPCNVQYEYVPMSPNDGMLRKYSLEEYRVQEPQDPYLQNQSYYSMYEGQPGAVSQSYRPVQQVQPYYSVQAPGQVVQTCHPSLPNIMQPAQKSQSQAGQLQFQQGVPQQLQFQQGVPQQLQFQQGVPQQLHLQQSIPQPAQQIQLVHPIQQMQQLQPNVEYMEIQSPRSRQSYMPFVKQNPITSEYYHDLTDIKEDKTPEPELPKHVTFDQPLVRDDSVRRKVKIPTISVEDEEDIYEPYVGLKKAPAAIRRKNMVERAERRKEENGEIIQNSFSKENGEINQNEKEAKDDIGKIGRFNVQKVDVARKSSEGHVKKKDDGEKKTEAAVAINGKVGEVKKVRRHTVHTSHGEIDEIEKTRRNAICPMTAYNVSGSSTVAIDNKIEQAMDLVKSHLMFAVREEVEVLKVQIAELIERNNQLEYENGILRAAASPETLAKLSQPRQQPPSSSS